MFLMSFLAAEQRVLKRLWGLNWQHILTSGNRRVVTRRPVSDQLAVDLELHNALCPILRKIAPFPIVSEESPRGDFTKIRSYWLLDPLDGSNEFRRGIPEYATSIALIHNGIPRAGVIYNPKTGEHFTSSSMKLLRAFPSTRRKPIYLISRSEHRRGLHLKPGGVSARFFPVGSIAYKLGLISAFGGELGLVSYEPKSSWDIGAGAAILRNRLGIRLRTLEGAPISFSKPWNRIPSLRVDATSRSPK